ncbi:MAG: YCF48-related protein [Ignavibacteria bacterium]
MKKCNAILLSCCLFFSSYSIIFSQSGWIQQSVNTTTSLNNIQFINNNTGWIVGDSGIICSTTNGGTNWLKDTYYSGDEILRSVYFKNQSTGIIGGCNGGNTAGFMLRTTNGGLGWNQMNFSGVPYDIFSFGGDTIWSSRHNGSVMKSTNMGINWTTTSIRSNLELYTVYFVNNLTGWTGGAVYGEYTYLYKTTNGGASWVLQFIHLTDHIYSIYFINNLTGFASTLRGSVYETTNGGNDWITKLAGSNEILFEVRFPDANTGYTAGVNKRILKTTDQGTSWIPQVLPPNISSSVYFTSINFRDVNTGWLIGNNGTILKTTNGGILGIENNGSTIPNSFRLSQNYPNPFNPTTTIEFDLPISSNVELIIFDITGREVERLVNQELRAGSYKYTFAGSKLSSGVYYYKMLTKNFSETKKFVLVK